MRIRMKKEMKAGEKMKIFNWYDRLYTFKTNYFFFQYKEDGGDVQFDE